MQIIQGTTEFVLPEKSAVAIGKFDGIHLGHRKLLDKLLELKKSGLMTLIFTFDPPPEVLFGGKAVKVLMTREEKRNAFKKMGIDMLIEFPLNKETAAIEPERFIREYLVHKLQASVIVAGTDVSFGSRGAGDAALLQKLAGEYGYFVELIEKVSVAGEEVSSTLIREAVSAGNLEKAEEFLGAPYRISGVVSHGRKFGRTIGMPTVNILPAPEKALPPNGVYYSRVQLGDMCYPAISNIGCKPTVSDAQIVGVETYLYEFEKDVYGQEITVELLVYKRTEMRFDGVDALKLQMQRDIDEGAVFHNGALGKK